MDCKAGDNCPIIETEWKTHEEFGVVLNELREAVRLSQHELAERANYNHSYLSRLERGQREPSRDVVERFIEVFGLVGARADRLRRSAGFSGENNTISHDESGLLAVNAMINNPNTDPEKKRMIRGILAVMGGVAMSGASSQMPEE